MKKLFSSILIFFFIVSLIASALAINILNEHVDVTTPTNKYDYVGRATLDRQNEAGIPYPFTVSISGRIPHNADLLYNTYGSITNIPGLSGVSPDQITSI